MGLIHVAECARNIHHHIDPGHHSRPQIADGEIAGKNDLVAAERLKDNLDSGANKTYIAFGGNNDTGHLAINVVARGQRVQILPLAQSMICFLRQSHGIHHTHMIQYNVGCGRMARKVGHIAQLSIAYAGLKAQPGVAERVDILDEDGRQAATGRLAWYMQNVSDAFHPAMNRVRFTAAGDSVRLL